MKAHFIEKIIDAALDQYIPGIEDYASSFEALVFQRALKSFLARAMNEYTFDGCNRESSRQVGWRAARLVEKARKEQMMDSGFVVDDDRTSGLRILTPLT